MRYRACLALKLSLNDKSVDVLSQCDDPVVALLALDAEAQGRTAKPIDKTLWASHMTTDGLYDEYWLLAYEANLKSWLPNSGGVDFVAADHNFGFLKNNNVSFYDGSRATPTGAAPIPMPTLPTTITFAGY